MMETLSLNYSFSDIIERVQKGGNPPFRPRVTNDLAENPLFVEMMKQRPDGFCFELMIFDQK